MTREEKINLLNKLLEIEEKNDIGNLTRAERGEFQQWVNKTLEQEPVIDKIRAEIADYQKEAVYSDDIVMTKRMILAIIDKYKAEQEGT